MAFVWPMTRAGLLRRLDRSRIERAIADAERSTSGELRLSVVGFFRGDLHDFAEKVFHRLRVDATQHRNGVLILLAPTRRRVAILGDAGIHAKVGDQFWVDLATTLSQGFRDHDFTTPLVAALGRVGQALATHFPAEDGVPNPNELPNEIDVGKMRP